MTLPRSVVFALAVLAGLCLAAVGRAQDDAAFDLESVLRGDGRGLTSADAARLALDGAPTLAVADAALEEAELAVRRATIALFPTLSLQARYTRLSPITNDPLVSGLGGGPETEALVAGVDDPEARALWTGSLAEQQALGQQSIPFFQDQLAFEGTLSIPLSELFLTLLPQLEAAGARIDAAAAQREVRRQALDARARQAFYGYVRARALRAVALRRTADAEEQLRVAERAREAGILRRSELLFARAQRNQARAAEVRAEAGVTASLEALRALTRLGPEEAVAVAEDVTIPLAPVTAPIDVLLADAYEHRAEVEALRAAARASARVRAAAEGGRWPVLRLVFGAQVNNPNPRYVPQRQRFDPTFDVSVVLAWSPNQTALAAARARSASVEEARLTAELARFEEGLRAEVTAAWAEDRASAATVDEARALVEATEEEHRASRRELAAGESRFVDLLEAELRLVGARVSFIEASIAARVARVRLAYVTGGAVAPPPP